MGFRRRQDAALHGRRLAQKELLLREGRLEHSRRRDGRTPRFARRITAG
jgi:hypothetical protein